MILELLRLMKTSGGYVADDAVAARVSLVDNSTVVESDDPKLAQDLEEFFRVPLLVRRSVGKEAGVCAHEVHIVPPDTEEFFREAVHCLRGIGLRGRILDEP
ncbi:MAG: hypothetical protein HYU64_12690 [Armatimonadetes bacterium]|nr:hypothetical protein [Armatimonadota bacterium]